MSLGRALALRAVTLVVVLFGVLLMVVIVLGATGVSDRVLTAYVSDQLRVVRQELSQKIREPMELERALEQYRAELTASYGLDRPWFQRLPQMILRVLTLDLGYSRTITSFTGSSRIADIIAERIPNTIILVTTSVIISAVIGITLGVRAAVRAGGLYDRILSLLSSVSFALPSWWTGLLFILVFSFYLGLFPFGGLYSAPPPSGMMERLADIIWHAILPVLTLVTVIVGSWAYISRTIVINTAREDFVNVARAKGLPESLILRRYIIRPSAPPIITNIVFAISGSIGGAILTETVFNFPGMGRLYYEAITSFDEGLVIALTYLYTLIYVASRFLLEVLYLLLDPRVRI